MILMIKLHREILLYLNLLTEKQNEVVIDENAETIWATELEIAGIFNKNRTLINKHIRNIYKEGELVEYSTSAKNALVQKERGRDVQREVTYYNLDVIISVGYRVKSKIATEFRNGLQVN